MYLKRLDESFFNRGGPGSIPEYTM